MTKDLKIEFAPGCFDDFEGSQEELDEMVASLKRMFESGEFLKNSTLVTEESIMEMPEDERERFLQWLEQDIDQPAERKLN